MILFTTEKDSIRFTLSKQDHETVDCPVVFNARRVSDERRLPGQRLFRGDEGLTITEADFDSLVTAWLADHSDVIPAPEPTLCFACKKPLESDYDTDYQFDNALWIRLDGGYGMFVDDLEDETQISIDVLGLAPGEAIPWPIGAPPWTPEQTAEYHRRAAQAANRVICHECAHDLCDAVPWFKKWIDPHSSHSHRTSYVETHPGHFGWDYSHRAEEASP